MLTHPEKGLFFLVASGLPVSEQKNESLVCKTVKLPSHTTSFEEQLASPCAGKYRNYCPCLPTVIL